MFLTCWQMFCGERGLFDFPGIKSQITTDRLPSGPLFLYPRPSEVLKDREEERENGREGPNVPKEQIHRQEAKTLQWLWWGHPVASLCYFILTNTQIFRTLLLARILIWVYSVLNMFSDMHCWILWPQVWSSNVLSASLASMTIYTETFTASPSYPTTWSAESKSSPGTTKFFFTYTNDWWYGQREVSVKAVSAVHHGGRSTGSSEALLR